MLSDNKNLMFMSRAIGGGIFTILLLCSFASATVYNIGPGKTYTTIGAAPWSSLVAGDTVNIYPQMAITGVTASSSTGMTITLVGSAGSIPLGSSVWFAGYTGTKTWVTCGAYGSGLYGTATGGTACSGSTVTVADAVTVGSGVTVYFTPPYFEKLIITTPGTAGSPVTIQGVADPVTGALPILDSHNATTGPNMAHTGSTAYHDSYGFVEFFCQAGQCGFGYAPTDKMAAYVTLANLRIQAGRPGLTGFDGSNASYTYASNASIRIEDCYHCTILNNEFIDSESGIFGAQNADTTPPFVITSLLVKGNHFYRTGAGSGSHQTYLEGNQITYEYNFYDKPTIGSACSQLKDRSRGTVIRYNLFYPSARELDLVAAQNSASQNINQVVLTVPAGGFTSGATTLTFTSSVAGIAVGDRVGYIHNTLGWGYPGSGLPIMPRVASVNTGTNTLTLDAPGMPASLAAAEVLNVISQAVNPYKQTFVYGNIFDWDQNLYQQAVGSIVHYGWDTAGGIDSVRDRAGTLYFYHNTIITRWDLSGSAGSMFGANIFQTESEFDNIRADNNLFYVANAGWANPTTYLTAMARGGYGGPGLTVTGILGGGTNQIGPSSSLGSNTCAGITLTGWAACEHALTSGSSISLTGWTSKTTSQLFPSGMNGRNYGLQSGSSAIGAASALPAAISSNTLGLDLTPAYEYGGAARVSLTDLGAFAYTGITYTLAVNKTGTGVGTVTGAGSYDSGTVVIPTATASTGSTFMGWSGACTGTGPCSVTLSANTTVTATFKLDPPPVASAIGSGVVVRGAVIH